MLRHSKLELCLKFLPSGLGAILLLASLLRAQQPGPGTGSAAASAQTKPREYTINVDVNMVVVHATVLDKKGHMVNDLQEQNFRLWEDGTLQKLAVFSHADIPVTMGIVIDDSGSMKEKREAVNAAALTFVKTSNPQDQVFVVNFNDVYYQDTPGDFAANMEELKSALDKIDSRGGTALYDAVYASLDHQKLGNRDKKVLLVITDGEDNSSRYTFDELLHYAQKSNAVIYTIGLLGDEEPGGYFKTKGRDRRAAKFLQTLAEATGGQAFSPKSLDETEQICEQIARDIRNQYTLAYYPSNTKKDGTFRALRVEATTPAKRQLLTVRARPGYFAPKSDRSSPAPPGN